MGVSGHGGACEMVCLVGSGSSDAESACCC